MKKSQEQSFKVDLVSENMQGGSLNVKTSLCVIRTTVVGYYYSSCYCVSECEELMYTVKKRKMSHCNQRQVLRQQTMCYQFLPAEEEVVCDPVLNVMVRLL